MRPPYRSSLAAGGLRRQRAPLHPRRWVEIRKPLRGFLPPGERVRVLRARPEAPEPPTAGAPAGNPGLRRRRGAQRAKAHAGGGAPPHVPWAARHDPRLPAPGSRVARGLRPHVLPPLRAVRHSDSHGATLLAQVGCAALRRPPAAALLPPAAPVPAAHVPLQRDCGGEGGEPCDAAPPLPPRGHPRVGGPESRRPAGLRLRASHASPPAPGSRRAAARLRSRPGAGGPRGPRGGPRPRRAAPAPGA
mmetsp:Transcript_5693/g.16152  ORF Transcript_5693/g.16152 Transcript_5693/m.16152 type:complete len:247 (-) Transcript_5693:246-986(-)